MANKRIIDLDAGSVNQHSWFEQADTENGKSEKVSADDISDYVGVRANYSSLDTKAKGLVGAVNEVNAKAGKIISDTLTAGRTTITLSDASITTDSWVKPYASVWGVMCTNMVVSAGSVALTFSEAQASDITVGVEVR
jgi:hypothetical protein